MLNTLLKVYSRSGIFEKAKELLTELEASGFAQDEVKYVASVPHTGIFNVHACIVPQIKQLYTYALLHVIIILNNPYTVYRCHTVY